MERLFKNIVFIAAAVMGLISCQKDDLTTKTDKGAVVIAVVEKATESKVEFTDNNEEGIDLKWENGDSFSIYDNKGEFVGDLICTNSPKGEFKNEAVTLKEGESYTAIYPVSEFNNLEDAQSADLTSVQDGDAISDLNKACKMEAIFTHPKNGNPLIKFKHKLAIMSFSFESENRPSKIVLRNGRDKYTVNYSNIEPEVVGGKNIYTSHIAIKPCEEYLRTVTFSLYNSSDTRYDIRTASTSKSYLAAVRYTAPASELEEDTRADHIVSEDEADYYTPPTKYRKTVNLVDDYGADNRFETNDSELLQSAIDDIAKAGGGKIIIPEGNYTFSTINLKSNIHLEIDSKVVIRPCDFDDTKNHYIFNCSGDGTEYLENVSIQGVGGKFTFDLRQLVNNKKIRCIQASTLKNFLYANIIIQDNNTIFSAIEFDGTTINGKVYGPEKGVIKDVDNFNSEYGYGLMQMQYGREMLFKDLYCLGGINLRFETHLKTYYGTDCKNYINKMVCRRITCENGHAAVALIPHYIYCGWVDARDIFSYGCETAVTIGGGYTTDEEAAAGHFPGYFSSETTIRNIFATATETKAQTNPSNYKYMVPEKQYLLPSKYPWEFKAGPSIQVVMYGAKYKIDIDDRDILQTTDFLDSQRWYYIDGAATEYIETLPD